MEQVLVFANGKPKDGEMVQRALQEGQQAQIIAADGGARVARYYDRMPDTVVGDMDSLVPDELLQLEELGVEIQRYPVEKDETDLELALKLAAARGKSWVRIIGGLGGRFDQQMANVYLLALPVLQGRDVALVAGAQSMQLLRPGEHTLRGDEYDTVSLIPIGGDVQHITTANLKYPLDDDVLRFGPARGISNMMEGDEASIVFEDGMLLCVHTKGRA